MSFVSDIVLPALRRHFDLSNAVFIYTKPTPSEIYLERGYEDALAGRKVDLWRIRNEQIEYGEKWLGGLDEEMLSVFQQCYLNGYKAVKPNLTSKDFVRPLKRQPR